MPAPHDTIPDIGPPGCPIGIPGEVAWEFQADGEIRGLPAVDADGTVYFGTMEAILYAVDCHGEALWTWEYPCDEAYLCPQAFEGSPAMATDGTLYVGDDIAVPNYLFAVTPEGELVWTWETSVVYGSMDASPALAEDGTIWVASHGESGYVGPLGQVAAVTPEGETRPLFPMATGPITQSPVVIGDTLYVIETTGDATVKAIGPAAALSWETSLTLGGWKSEPGDLAVDPEGAIVAATVADMGGDMGPILVLMRLAADSGEVLWQVTLPVNAPSVVGAPVIREVDFGFEIAVALSDGTTALANPYSGGAMIQTLLGPVDIFHPEVIGGGPAWGDDGALYVPRPIAMGEAPSPGIMRIVTGPQVQEEHFSLGALSGTVKTSLQLAPGGMIYAGMDDGRLVAWRSQSTGPDLDASWPTERHDPSNTGRPNQSEP